MLAGDLHTACSVFFAGILPRLRAFACACDVYFARVLQSDSSGLRSLMYVVPYRLLSVLYS